VSILGNGVAACFMALENGIYGVPWAFAVSGLFAPMQCVYSPTETGQREPFGRGSRSLLSNGGFVVVSITGMRCDIIITT